MSVLEVSRGGVVSFCVDVPGNEWLSANGRYGHLERAARTRRLRERAYYLARQQGLPRFSERVRVDCYVHSRRQGGRMDPANAYPAVKAIVDGLTDARVWVDDDDAHLQGPVPHQGEPVPSLAVGFHRITLTITPLGDAGGVAADGVKPGPGVRGRRRPRKRFDYRPQQRVLCPSCGKRYDPVSGTCGCNDKP